MKLLREKQDKREAEGRSDTKKPQYEAPPGELEQLKGTVTHSLFFSLTLAPFRSSSSATCFLFGWGEATAQC